MSEQTTSAPGHARDHAHKGATFMKKDYWCPPWCNRQYCGDPSGGPRYHSANLGWTDYAGYATGAAAYQVDVMWAQRREVDPDMATALIAVTEQNREGRGYMCLSELSPRVAQQLAQALTKGAQMLLPLEGRDAPSLDTDRLRARRAQLMRRARKAQRTARRHEGAATAPSGF